VLVLGHQREKATQLVHLALHVGVEQGLVALTAAPEHVVLAAEAVGCFQDLDHLRGSVGEHFRIRVGGGAREIAAIAEQVGRAPEQLHARALHLALHALQDAIEVLVALAQSGSFGRHVAVVKREVGDAELLEELERSYQLRLCLREGVTALVPGALERALAEDVRAFPRKRVPVTHCGPELGGHALSEHHPVLVVVAVGERIVALGALVFDGRDTSKIALSHDFDSGLGSAQLDDTFSETTPSKR
jgi:hypothetical protein